MAVDRRTFLAALAGSALLPAPRAAATGWRARVATVDITPRRSTWMAGFAARTSPSQGVERPLHAKALCLDDGAGSRVVLVTLDLLGLTTGVGARIAEEARRRHGLARAQLLLNSSHTHCGPVIDEMLAVAYDMTDAQWRDVRAYTHELEGKVGRLIGSVLKPGAPVVLRYAEGRAAFAANRRVQFTPLGPVDHRVPVLRVDGYRRPLAIVFGYACHNTTLNFQLFSGDYAGHAQAVLEADLAGVTAIFLTGCGGDQNPYPRRAPEFAERHGRSLATAVEASLETVPVKLSDRLRVKYELVTLDFATPPTREALMLKVEGPNKVEAAHARRLLEQLKTQGRITDTYSYPVQTVQFGDELLLVALAGEVVVDYSLRLKRELKTPHVWVAGYSNDVFGYVPSRRVLEEGGYEGGGAMLHTNLPGPFAPSVEERIIDKVLQLAR